MCDAVSLQKFNELQSKYIFSRKQLLQCGAQLQFTDREMKRCHLTLAELEPLGEDVSTYRSVGDFFFKGFSALFFAKFLHWLRSTKHSFFARLAAGFCQKNPANFLL